MPLSDANPSPAGALGARLALPEGSRVTPHPVLRAASGDDGIFLTPKALAGCVCGLLVSTGGSIVGKCPREVAASPWAAHPAWLSVSQFGDVSAHGRAGSSVSCAIPSSCSRPALLCIVHSCGFILLLLFLQEMHLVVLFASLLGGSSHALTSCPRILPNKLFLLLFPAERGLLVLRAEKRLRYACTVSNDDTRADVGNSSL